MKMGRDENATELLDIINRLSERDIMRLLYFARGLTKNGIKSKVTNK